ncbi:hypothetical protein FHU38_002646 [Saccharomonospora amisosensis]|uniref:Uncharacterized protein n=1 Tax=Saccharomonospora amisosensis TaxID=1128677 RepID=A0A7X5UQE3_9PSEU|nr:hypothetical protein [Saccharomonospora amisosensis]NIJ12302.1 hypothetical protein [Saccharomonospora amisosensis]
MPELLELSSPQGSQRPQGPKRGPWRHVLPGPGPLVRRVDRVEGAAFAVTVLLALLAVPAAVAVGGRAYARQVRLAREQAADRHPVTAVVLADATRARVPVVGSRVRVPGRWRTQQGQRRRGLISVAAGTKAGAERVVWLDRRGEMVPSPVSTRRAGGIAAAAGIGTWLAAAAGLAAGYGSVKAVLAGYRLRAWGRAWERVAAEWARREASDEPPMEE